VQAGAEELLMDSAKLDSEKSVPGESLGALSCGTDLERSGFLGFCNQHRTSSAFSVFPSVEPPASATKRPPTPDGAE
jgi:hypothetical protein